MAITLSPSAARRVAEIIAKEPQGSHLRISVKGGGCSGFQYTFDIVAGSEADDVRVERDGTAVLIDAVSVPYMEGAEIDFVDDLMGSAFKINNPNATASCGCGTSFAI
jgi:iron-sulfur cluster assembly accessory protein